MAEVPPFLQAQADFRAGKKYQNPHPLPEKWEIDAPYDLYKQGWKVAKWRYEHDTALIGQGDAA